MDANFNFKPLTVITMASPGKSVEKRNNTDEFNRLMSMISSLVSQGKAGLDEKSVREFGILLERLLTNEYFHLMYLNNMFVRGLVLGGIELMIEVANEPMLKMDVFVLVYSLLEWDVKLETIEFRSESATSRYRHMLGKLLPHVTDLMKTLAGTNIADSQSLLMIAGEGYKQTRRSTRPLIKLICYMLICVPFQVMFKEYCLAEFLGFIASCAVSAKNQVKIALGLAANICHYGAGFGANTSGQSLLGVERDEDEKIGIFSLATEQTVSLLEAHIRNESCRGMLKRALNIYCECITRHVEQMRPGPAIILADSDASPEAKWSNCLYQIVISIVRILRLDFENQQNTVDIELVIYFYEILANNMDSLTSEDAFNIAIKLMDILVKINEWSEQTKQDFSTQQFVHLKSLSYDLANKFINTLKTDYPEHYWKKLAVFWMEGILDWEPTAYRIISTFCMYSRGRKYLDYNRTLVNAVIKSWRSNINVDDVSETKPKPRKNFKLFMKTQMLDAMVDLAIVYDETFNANTDRNRMLLDEIGPFFQIFLFLFGSSRAENKLEILTATYNRLWQNLRSTFIKTAEFWNQHLELVVRNLFEITENPPREFDPGLSQPCVELIKSIYSFFDPKLVNEYEFVLRQILEFLKAHLPNSSQLKLEDRFPFLRIFE